MVCLKSIKLKLLHHIFKNTNQKSLEFEKKQIFSVKHKFIIIKVNKIQSILHIVLKVINLIYLKNL